MQTNEYGYGDGVLTGISLAVLVALFGLGTWFLIHYYVGLL